MSEAFLSQIRLDGGTQMRSDISAATVATYSELIADGAEFPPVVAFYDGTDYWLADGFHRHAAYKQAGKDTISVDMRSGDRLDAIRYALKANATNGRPRTSEDMKRAYRAAVDNQLCDAADANAVCKLLGCSTRWARALTQEAREAAKVERNEKIVELAEQGKSQREIAAEVGVSRKVVETVGSKRNSSEMSQPEGNAVLDTGPDIAELERRESLGKAKQIKKENHAIKSASLEAKLAERTKETATGLITLTNGDAWHCHTDIPDDSVDLLITDPPYSTDVDDIESFCKWMAHWLPKVKDSGRAYVFIGAYPKELQAYLNEAAKESRLVLDNILVWTYRNTIGPSPKNSYKLNWQACLYFYGPDAPPLDCPVMTEQFTVQDVNAPDARTGVRLHAWQKPDDLAERLIRHSTTEGQTVVDPFCGTGTFISAASRLGRNAVGYDRSDEMLALCERRGLTVAA